MARKRTNIQIIVEMLRLAERGVGKTELMYGANMSHAQKEKYLEYLVEKGLLKLRSGLRRARTEYCTTDQGRRFLEDIGKMADVLGLDLGE